MLPLWYAIFISCALGEYLPNWESLDSRPLPLWFDQAKFGIFMHWGLYSVPSYGASAEWFWWWWQGAHRALQTTFMQKNYKPQFSYSEFAPMLTCEHFDANHFAEVVRKSGAKYFVFTSKHHEGYAMWPSAESMHFNSLDTGPHKDLVGELASAIRKAGIRFGLYYSLYEWFNPLFLSDTAANFTTQSYVENIVHPQLYDLINKYKPEVLWSDGDWNANDTYWNSTQFLAWLYNESPVKNTVVTNDRWGRGIMCKHGGFFTCSDRFNPKTLQPRKWENCYTIDTQSWGFRRDAKLNDYLTAEQLVKAFIETVSCGGNFLLNVGPTHDGRILPIFEERLYSMGEWLSINGEGIFETTPWFHQNDSLTEDVWYTARTSHTMPFVDNRSILTEDIYVYAFFFKWPEDGVLQLGSIFETFLPATTFVPVEGVARSLVLNCVMSHSADEPSVVALFTLDGPCCIDLVCAAAVAGICC
uniref:Putative alpha-L-fucosidase n=1 Tax=Trichuris muris TaxID=70415 RepID=A0A5S6QA82_TRIMR